MLTTIYISLGSNLGDRLLNLTNANQQLSEYLGKVLKKSAIYESEPWGYKDEFQYYNQVLEISTSLTPHDALTKCLEIEDSLGRIRTRKAYEARTIDIDLLFFGNEIIDTSELSVPHPLMQDRRFVLEPLKEIAPDYIHPVLHKNIAELYKKCSDTNALKKLNTP